MRAIGLPLTMALALLLSACATTGSPATQRPAETQQTDAVLPATGGVDYQLGGASAPDEGVGIVVRDATEEPAPGLFSVCYVNGFQTQPGTLETWLDEAPAGILMHDGEPVVDPEWPDEAVLDSSTTEGRDAVLRMLEPQIVGCATTGFDAVEVDNLDAHTRFEGLTERGALELAASLVAIAHDAGLLVAQKNTVELGEQGRELGFDFAIVEECLSTDECDDYAEIWGDDVIDIEYADVLDADEFADRCDEAPNPRLTIMRDRDLVPAGDADRIRIVCA